MMDYRNGKFVYMGIEIIAFVVKGSEVNHQTLLIDRSRFKREAEALLSVVSLISNGYI